jgi:hypothetical protein
VVGGQWLEEKSTMNLGALPAVGSVAASGAAQRVASEDRVRQETVDQQRQTESATQAELAAGIGQTDEDHETSERDADGRLPWELTRRKPKSVGDNTSPAFPSQVRDPQGISGTQLDLTG